MYKLYIISNLFVLETFSVLCSIAFLYLLSKNRRICWLFGISGSVAGVLLMHLSNLQGQMLLYGYYVAIGIYGWWQWGKTTDENRKVYRVKAKRHVMLLLSGLVIAALGGYLLSILTQNPAPYADATISVFAVMASWMQAHRWLSNWIYWFIINTASALLYAHQNLYGYALLMLFYCVMCVYGYRKWINLPSKQ